jgi:hypothetical protein
MLEYLKKRAFFALQKIAMAVGRGKIFFSGMGGHLTTNKPSKFHKLGSLSNKWNNFTKSLVVP